MGDLKEIARTLENRKNLVMLEMDEKRSEIENLLYSAGNTKNIAKAFELSNIYYDKINEIGLFEEKYAIGRDILKSYFKNTILSDGVYSRVANGIKISTEEFSLSISTTRSNRVELVIFNLPVEPRENTYTKPNNNLIYIIEQYHRTKRLQDLAALVELESIETNHDKTHKLTEYIKAHRKYNKSVLKTLQAHRNIYNEKELKYQNEKKLYETAMISINEKIKRVTDLKEIKSFKDIGWTIYVNNEIY